jgi:5-methylcytosine-specific restriction endonuclease McrA
LWNLISTPSWASERDKEDAFGELYASLDGKDWPKWEADHIVPLQEGGALLDPSNVRTLCLPCHALVTRQLRRRMFVKRKTKRDSTPVIPGFELIYEKCRMSMLMLWACVTLKTRPEF